MKIEIVMHEAEEGGFWAEVPAIPGCATQGDSMEELMQIFMRQLRRVCHEFRRHPEVRAPFGEPRRMTMTALRPRSRRARARTSG
jgi:hypothetical protein